MITARVVGLIKTTLTTQQPSALFSKIKEIFFSKSLQQDRLAGGVFSGKATHIERADAYPPSPSPK
jgi:hypothetical protein